jgi:predicted transglutaminase-like protease
VEKMKGKLIFDLPEDRVEFEIALKSMDWALTVWEIDQYLRKQLKYKNESRPKSQAIVDIRKELLLILDSRNLTLDTIT